MSDLCKNWREKQLDFYTKHLGFLSFDCGIESEVYGLMYCIKSLSKRRYNKLLSRMRRELLR